MKISVLSPDKSIFEGEISSVKVPGSGGQFQVLNNHAAIVSALVKGDVEIVKGDGGKMSFAIEKGFIEVLKNDIALLVEGVEE